MTACVDAPGWTDANGLGCADYRSNGWCANGWYGPNWTAPMGFFSDYRSPAGVSAEMACCECGLSRPAAVGSACVFGAWGAWGACGTDKYGSCEQVGRRAVVTPAGRLATPCGASVQNQSCGGSVCPACSVTGWSPWSGCLASGLQLRTRAVTSAFVSGALCPALMEATVCQTSSGALAAAHTAGYNGEGALGLADFVDRSAAADVPRTATPASLLQTVPVAGLRAGRYHTALLAGGVVLVFGGNADGQLGLGDDIPRARPTLFPSPNRQVLSDAALGGAHTAGLLSGGSVFVVGANADGQLGLGDLTTRFTAAALPLPAGMMVTAVALGGAHSAYVTAAGALYVAGGNAFGQLGVGDTADRRQPTPVPVAGGQAVARAALGAFHSAVLTANGALFVFGNNDYGQLGMAAIGHYLSPQPLNFGPTVTSLSLGGAHSAFLTAAGSLYLCGLNDQGQLGLGDTAPRTAPTPVGSASTVRGVSLGEYHSAFLDAAGTVHVFGHNAYGQLGLGDTANRATPQPLPSAGLPGPVTTLALGGFHTAVLTAQTGTPTPTPTPSRTPTAVPTPTATPTGSATPTPSMTRTRTAAIPPCNNATALPTNAPLTFTAAAACAQALAAGEGSSLWLNRVLTAQATRVSGTVSVEVDSGVPATASECTVLLTAAGQTKTIPLGDTSAAGFVVRYAPGAAAAFEADAAGDTEVLLVVSTSATLLLMALVTIGTGFVMVIVSVCAWFATWRLMKRHKRKAKALDRTWQLNPRVYNVWGQLLLVSALFLAVCAAICLCIEAATSAPTIGPMWAVIPSSLIAGVGLLAAAGWAVWAYRDPDSHDCPGCGDPVSRWRFVGLYLPPLDGAGGGRCRKAHRRHMLCRHCRKPVVEDGWPEAPAATPYHSVCWRQHCREVMLNSTYLTQSEVTDIELVCTLALAIKHSAASTVSMLLSLQPNLATAPIPDEGGCTALHLAARTGNLPILLLLLQSQPILDSRCCVDRDAKSSILVQGLSSSFDDVYICQPFAMFNRQPLYVGHAHGNYIYYSDPREGASSGDIHGWCLSPHLGAASSAFSLGKVENKSERPRTMSYSSHSTSTGPNLTAAPSSSSPAASGSSPRAPSVWDDLLRTVSFSSVHQSSPSRATQPITTLQWLPFVDVTVTKERPSEAPSPKNAVPEGTTVRWVPAATSVLEEAVRSGDLPTIRHLAGLYRAADPGCLLWRYHVGHSLWLAYPMASQAAIHGAVLSGAAHVTVTDINGAPATVVFDTPPRHVCGPRSTEVRAAFRPVFQFGDELRQRFRTTAEFGEVLDWATGAVLLNPGQLAFVAPDPQTLMLLHQEGAVDFSLWAPPCLTGAALHVRAHGLEAVLGAEVAAAMGLEAAAAARVAMDWCANRGKVTRAERDTGFGGRLTDGLEQPETLRAGRFYEEDYRSDEGTLPFCAALPINDLGMRFQLVSLMLMSSDAVMKVYELQRQGHLLNPRHVVPIFVYSYELAYSEEPGDQIYECMNRAMRLRDARLVDYWRPLIYAVDHALQALPSFHGKCYRGISCSLDPAMYRVGSLVCWPSFSSASQRRAVAEEFVRDAVGTLFFLQSTSAKTVSNISRYPEEAEVVFPPNTLFRITSTLQGASDIGQFYAKIDNIAMSQCAGDGEPLSERPAAAAAPPQPPPRPDPVRLAGHTSFLLHVPTTCVPVVVELLGASGVTVAMPPAGPEEAAALRDTGVAGELVVLSPRPEPLTTRLDFEWDPPSPRSWVGHH